MKRKEQELIWEAYTSAIDPEQLKMGIAVEHEHTMNKGFSEEEANAIAEEIARDHLAEDPQYYTKLKAAGL